MHSTALHSAESLCISCHHCNAGATYLGAGERVGLDQRSYSTPGPVSTRMGDRCGRVNRLGLGMQPATYVNSAFPPSGVDKSSTSLQWLGVRRVAIRLCRVASNIV